MLAIDDQTDVKSRRDQVRIQTRCEWRDKKSCWWLQYWYRGDPTGHHELTRWSSSTYIILSLAFFFIGMCDLLLVVRIFCSNVHYHNHHNGWWMVVFVRQIVLSLEKFKDQRNGDEGSNHRQKIRYGMIRRIITRCKLLFILITN